MNARLSSTGAALLGVLLLSHCGGHQPEIIRSSVGLEELAAYRTYAWSAKQVVDLENSESDPSVVGRRIIAAMNRGFQDRGWTRTSPGQADVLVSYEVTARKPAPRWDDPAPAKVAYKITVRHPASRWDNPEPAKVSYTAGRWRPAPRRAEPKPAEEPGEGVIPAEEPGTEAKPVEGGDAALPASVEGDLSFEMRDRRTGRPVYRGSAKPTLLDDPSEWKAESSILNAVTSMLKDLPRLK